MEQISNTQSVTFFRDAILIFLVDYFFGHALTMVTLSMLGVTLGPFGIALTSVVISSVIVFSVLVAVGLLAARLKKAGRFRAT